MRRPLLLTDVIRQIIKDEIEVLGTQTQAEAWLGVERSTLSRFVRGSSVNSETMDRFVEAIGIDRVGKRLRVEHRIRVMNVPDNLWDVGT